MKRPTACPSCGGSNIKVNEPKTYDYRQSGLDNITLRGGVMEIHCSDCGRGVLQIWNEWQLLQVIAIAILGGSSALTGAEQKYLRKTCQLTQEELSERLGLNRRESVAERESRKDATLDPANDLLFRVVILDCFEDLLKQPGENFLHFNHHELLEKTKTSLFTRGRDLARATEPRRGRGVVTVEPEAENWHLASAA